MYVGGFSSYGYVYLEYEGDYVGEFIYDVMMVESRGDIGVEYRDFKVMEEEEDYMGLDEDMRIGGGELDKG